MPRKGVNLAFPDDAEASHGKIMLADNGSRRELCSGRMAGGVAEGKRQYSSSIMHSLNVRYVEN